MSVHLWIRAACALRTYADGLFVRLPARVCARGSSSGTLCDRNSFPIVVRGRGRPPLPRCGGLAPRPVCVCMYICLAAGPPWIQVDARGGRGKDRTRRGRARVMRDGGGGIVCDGEGEDRVRWISQRARRPRVVSSQRAHRPRVASSQRARCPRVKSSQRAQRPRVVSSQRARLPRVESSVLRRAAIACCRLVRRRYMPPHVVVESGIGD